jgi:hypothetical protein
MTTNHDYNTPERGETNWDVPLNNNFKRLDVDVEIRDNNSNLESYEPTEKSKFLAIDTGDMYVGDGSEWQILGTIGETVSNEDGSIVAGPGDVQAALDNATYDTEWARSPCNRVVLESGTIYEPSDTWIVGPNTILDFNGAMVCPDHSTDVIHLAPRTKLIRPYIDVRMTDWSDATMMVLDTRFGAPYSGESAPDIEDCLLMAPTETGTGIQLRDSQAEGMGGGLHISGQIQGFNTGIELLADGGPGAWVNSVELDVKLTNFKVGIEHKAVAGAATNGHLYDVDSQPNSGSEWLWKLGTDSKCNTMMATVWDTYMYTDETFWYLSSDCGYNNTLVDTMQVHGDWQFVDDSDYSSNTISRWSSDSFQYNE